MAVKVGTFNLNNLFSRYNFEGEIEAIKEADVSLENKITYEFGSDGHYKTRTYQGRLIKGKPDKDTKITAKRILNMDADVLAVQEVEDIDTLKRFNRDYLKGLYKNEILVEGNDDRLIDIGLLSKYPIGPITSWQKEMHPGYSEPIFGRDLLEVEILNHERTAKLFTLFINHLKSHFVPRYKDSEKGQQKNNELRAMQAETVSKIIKKENALGEQFIVLGDMNDPADSRYLESLTMDPTLQLVNALADPKETRPAKKDNPPPPSKAWTYRYKPEHQPAQYALFDQIWLSLSLASKLEGAWIDRRTKHSGDGSDHDPSWVELDI